MSYLVDTNIVIRQMNANDAEHGLVSLAVRTLLRRGETLFYTQQTRREFWNVCTRPRSANGLGLTVDDTLLALQALDAVFTRLPDGPTAGFEWDRLVVQYQVLGRQVHDAQPVASMLGHGVTHLLTLNTADFTRYSAEITVVHPAEI